MHANDELEIRHLHFGEGLVAQHARVVDQDVDAAPFLFRPRRHRGDLLEIGDVGGIGDRSAARGADFLHDLQRVLGRRAVSPQVVDDDLSAARRKAERMRAPEPRARAGDNGDPAVKPDCHDLPRTQRPAALNVPSTDAPGSRNIRAGAGPTIP